MTESERLLVEQICAMRAVLRSASDSLDDILSDGLPEKGESMDSLDAYDQWYEDRHWIVKRAKEVLFDTEGYAGIV